MLSKVKNGCLRFAAKALDILADVLELWALRK